MSEAFWQRAEPLIPVRTHKKKAGRPAKSDRQMLGAMVYVLRTGLQWNALPREIGANSTVYDRFRLIHGAWPGATCGPSQRPMGTALARCGAGKSAPIAAR